MEARKLRDKHKKPSDLKSKEENFNVYVNGPNKHISTNKARYNKKQTKGEISGQRKKWHSPSVSSPMEQEYHNPVNL